MLRFKPARLLAIVTVLGVCVAGLLTQVQTGFVLYGSPYAEALPWGSAGEPLSERVVLCLIDGLREDTSRVLDPLNALRERGADWTLTVTEPTFSIPLSNVIAAGAPQTTIGLLHNRTPIGDVFYERFGTIYSAAHHAGLRTGNVVTWPATSPIASVVDEPNFLPEAVHHGADDGLAPRLCDMLAAENAPQFIWVHFDVVDKAGHRTGGASPEYAEAARRTAERIATIAGAMDLSRETLIVTADHGHRDRGGHGGPEPEVATVPCVMAGAGIAPGTVGRGEQIGLAATVAWLLGTPIPTHSQGWPLVEALDMPGDVRARRARDTVAQRLAAYQFRLRQLGVTDEKVAAPMPHGLRLDLVDAALAGERWDVTYALSVNLANELRARWVAWLSKIARERLQPRIYAAAGLGLLACVGSVVIRRRAVAAGAPAAKNPPVWLVAGILVGVGLPVLLFVLGPDGYSFSGTGRGGIGPFALPRFAEGAAGLWVGYAVARVLIPAAQRRVAPRGTVLASIAGGIAGVALAGAAVYLVGFGLRPQPWQQSFVHQAILLVGGLQFLGVALCAFPCAFALAVSDRREREADADTPPGSPA